MADLTKNLLVKLTGDSKSAQTAFLELEAASAKSQKATADLALKIQEDFRKMENAAQKAAESIRNIDNPGGAGAGGGGGLGGGLFAGFTVTAGDLINVGQRVEQFAISTVKGFTDAADAVRRFEQTTGATAEESSRFINLANLLGVSSDTLSAGLGKFGASLEKNALLLRQHGIQLAANKDGSVDLLGTFVNVTEALGKSTNAAEKDALAKQLLGRGYQTLLPLLSQSADEMRRLAGEAGKGPILDENEVQKALHFQEQLRGVGQQVANIKNTVGSNLIDHLDATAAGLDTVWHKLQNINNELGGPGGEKVKSILGGIADGFARVTPAIGPVYGLAKTAVQGLEDLGNSGKQAGADVAAGADQGSAGIDELGASATITEGKLWTMAASMRSAQSAWSQFQNDANYSSNASDKFSKSLEALDTAETKASGASSNLADAQEAGAQRIADAQQRIVDAKQKVIDAEQNLAEVTESAEQRVADAQETASRAAESAEQRVGDAKQRLADAINASLRDSNPYSANRTVEDARQALQRAEADQTRTLGDNAKNVAKAREEADKQVADAKKGIVSATKDEQKAEEDLGKTLREVEKSMRSAQGAADNANASLSTQKGRIDDVVRATGDKVFAQALDKESLDHINETIDTAKQKIEEQATKWGLSKDEVKKYIDKINEIPKRIETTLGLTVDLYGFERQVDAAMQFFANPNDPNTRAGVEAAAAASAGNLGGGFLPTFDSGGVVPGSVGDPVLAIVHGGEQVLTPEQRAAGWSASGGDVHIHMGTLVMEHELADLLTRLRQHGYAGV